MRSPYSTESVYLCQLHPANAEDLPGSLLTTYLLYTVIHYNLGFCAVRWMPMMDRDEYLILCNLPLLVNATLPNPVRSAFSTAIEHPNALIELIQNPETTRA